MAILYLLEFSSGRLYVGLTRGKLSKRIAGHKKDAFKRMRDLPIYNAWRKYGDPKISIIQEGSIEEIAQAEINAIIDLNCRVPNGYNIAFGGSISPMKTPECRAKLSINNPMKRKEIREARSGEGHHSKLPEQRKRASEQQKKSNNMKSDSAKLKSSISHKGNKHSEETKLKMSLAAKGRPIKFELSPENLAKRGAAIRAGHARRREALTLKKGIENE